MIFKVCQYDVNRSNWVFIADVAELSTGRLFLRERKTGKVNVHSVDIYAEPSSPELKDGEGRSDSPVTVDNVFLPRWMDDELLTGKHPFLKVSVVYLMLRNGTGKSVVFHEAYLLNDEGKTIERL